MPSSVDYTHVEYPTFIRMTLLTSALRKELQNCLEDFDGDLAGLGMSREKLVGLTLQYFDHHPRVGRALMMDEEVGRGVVEEEEDGEEEEEGCHYRQRHSRRRHHHHHHQTDDPAYRKVSVF